MLSFPDGVVSVLGNSAKTFIIFPVKSVTVTLLGNPPAGTK